MSASIGKRALARALRPFTRVEPHEAVGVALMTVTAFLLLTGYYLLKTVREPLVLMHGGAELKLYLRAGQTVLMVGFVQLYGQLARRVGRGRLLLIVFAFFIVNLALFTVLARADVEIGIVFFLWVGVFSYTSVAQFWALAADVYTDEQGKRLFPIIGAGSSIGAVVGGVFAKSLVPHGAAVLMGTALLLLVICLAMIAWVERRSRGLVVVQEVETDEPLAYTSPWQLLSRDRFLILIGCLVVLLNWVNSSGEYLLDRTLLVAAREAAAHGVSQETYIGEFKADYFAWYNGIGMVLQLFLVSRILRHLGVRRALLFLPGFAIVAYGGAVFFPVLAVMRLVKIGENSLLYSVQDTTRHALFLVGTRIEKFVGKTAVETIAVRVGAVLSSLAVFVGTRLGWSTRDFAALDAVLALAWLGFAIAIGREHRRREAALVRESPTRAP
jgi:AAA family ATP:ADP antiporter